MEELSVLSNDKADYLVKVRRGGEITHVWQLKDAIIKYSETMKGWEVFIENETSWFFSGEVEIWRIPRAQPFTQTIKKSALKKEVIQVQPTVLDTYLGIYKTIDVKEKLFPGG